MSISEPADEAMVHELQQMCSVNPTSTATLPTTSSTSVSSMSATTSTHDVEMVANGDSGCNGASSLEDQSTSRAVQGQWLYTSYHHMYTVTTVNCEMSWKYFITLALALSVK
jgi:hypothetical protein